MTKSIIQSAFVAAALSAILTTMLLTVFMPCEICRSNQQRHPEDKDCCVFDNQKILDESVEVSNSHSSEGSAEKIPRPEVNVVETLPFTIDCGYPSYSCAIEKNNLESSTEELIRLTGEYLDEKIKLYFLMNFPQFQIISTNTSAINTAFSCFAPEMKTTVEFVFDASPRAIVPRAQINEALRWSFPKFVPHPQRGHENMFYEDDVFVAIVRNAIKETQHSRDRQSPPSNCFSGTGYKAYFKLLSSGLKKY